MQIDLHLPNLYQMGFGQQFLICIFLDLGRQAALVVLAKSPLGHDQGNSRRSGALSYRGLQPVNPRRQAVQPRHKPVGQLADRRARVGLAVNQRQKSPRLLGGQRQVAGIAGQLGF